MQFFLKKSLQSANNLLPPPDLLPHADTGLMPTVFSLTSWSIPELDNSFGVDSTSISAKRDYGMTKITNMYITICICLYKRIVNFYKTVQNKLYFFPV